VHAIYDKAIGGAFRPQFTTPVVAIAIANWQLATNN
jgi:hypothetical protein